MNIYSAKVKRLKTNLADRPTKMGYELACYNRAAQTLIHSEKGLFTTTKLTA